jgi:hypothetical protein
MFTDDVLEDLRRSESSRRAEHDTETEKALASLEGWKKAHTPSSEGTFALVFVFGLLFGLVVGAAIINSVP